MFISRFRLEVIIPIILTLLLVPSPFYGADFLGSLITMQDTLSRVLTLRFYFPFEVDS